MMARGLLPFCLGALCISNSLVVSFSSHNRRSSLPVISGQALRPGRASLLERSQSASESQVRYRLR